MGLTNFIITVAGVSAVILLLRSDVKQSATIFRRNVKHIRHWLEEETSAAFQMHCHFSLFELGRGINPETSYKVCLLIWTSVRDNHWSVA
uniref:Uncharacterized protein n=1 Tax=Salix viminalis TaxID=40686 RepID=A0A6N2L967_SALVM